MICDSQGISKAIVQSLTQEQKDIIVKSLQNDNIVEYKGKISLPV